jgi:hypothetical protein
MFIEIALGFRLTEPLRTPWGTRYWRGRHLVVQAQLV